MSSAGVLLLGAFAVIALVVVAWPTGAARSHRRRIAIVLALVAVIVACSIVGQYLFHRAGRSLRLDCTTHSTSSDCY